MPTLYATVLTPKVSMPINTLQFTKKFHDFFFSLENIATQEKICQDLTPFRTLDSNHQKTEISTHDDSWENEHDTDEEEMMTEEEAYFLTQFRQFPALVQLNIRQLYNVWISSQK